MSAHQQDIKNNGLVIPVEINNISAVVVAICLIFSDLIFKTVFLLTKYLTTFHTYIRVLFYIIECYILIFINGIFIVLYYMVY